MNKPKSTRAWAILAKEGDEICIEFLKRYKPDLSANSCITSVEVEILPVEQVEAMRNLLQEAKKRIYNRGFDQLDYNWLEAYDKLTSDEPKKGDEV